MDTDELGVAEVTQRQVERADSSLVNAWTHVMHRELACVAWIIRAQMPDATGLRLDVTEFHQQPWRHARVVIVAIHCGPEIRQIDTCPVCLGCGSHGDCAVKLRSVVRARGLAESTVDVFFEDPVFPPSPTTGDHVRVPEFLEQPVDDAVEECWATQTDVLGHRLDVVTSIVDKQAPQFSALRIDTSEFRCIPVHSARAHVVALRRDDDAVLDVEMVLPRGTPQRTLVEQHVTQILRDIDGEILESHERWSGDAHLVRHVVHEVALAPH